MIAIYTRVSTTTQTIDSHLEELRKYCHQRGWRDVQEFTGCISGGTQSRAGLDRLMGMVRRGKVSVVVAFKLDRLARNLAHMAQLIGEFQSHGTALICPSQGIDTSNNNNPAASFQLNILAAVAEFERSLTSRTRQCWSTCSQAAWSDPWQAKQKCQTPAARIELLRANRCRQVIERELRLPRSSVGELVRDAERLMAREVV